MNAQEALQKLQLGNARYIADETKNDLRNQERRQELVKGQHPFAIILSCADSRVVPELIFDTGIGELFVLRVAGNVANISTVASIEYAVANLQTKLILVMGHESCGAVSATMAGKHVSKNLDSLVRQIQPAVEANQDSEVSEVVKENARINAQELLNKSQIISEAVTNGLEIIPAYYHLSTGKVDFSI